MILEFVRRILLPDDYCRVSGIRRSKDWPDVRKDHLAKFPFCAACGGIESLQVHHIRPFHIYRLLELDPTNLLTLCESSSRLCHFTFGHFFDWKKYNPKVVEMCQEFSKLRVA